jgi:hypothetical protein
MIFLAEEPGKGTGWSQFKAWARTLGGPRGGPGG